MPKRGKKYLEMAKAVDRGRLYEPQEAIDLLEEYCQSQLRPHG